MVEVGSGVMKKKASSSNRSHPPCALGDKKMSNVVLLKVSLRSKTGYFEIMKCLHHKSLEKFSCSKSILQNHKFL